MAALIPGLEIQAEGAYDDQHQLVAKPPQPSFPWKQLESIVVFAPGLFRRIPGESLRFSL